MENNVENMDTTETRNNEDERKLFVGGLSQDTKDNDINEYFGQFGEIEGINLKTDATTGRSRGFAFVVFKSVEGVNAAVASETHTIKNKKVAVKKAQAKQGKIYVGKLKAELTDEQIKEFFSGYGAIATIEQPFDKAKNERKNFCFITFEKEDTAKKLLKEGTVTVDGHELEVKKVTPKPGQIMGPMSGFAGAGGFASRGGRGGAMGGYGGYGGGGGGGGGGYPPQWGGYGDYWAGYAGYNADPYGYQGWGGYGGGGGGGGGWGGGFCGPAGGKTPRGGPRGGGRGRGAARGGPRQKPY